MSVALYVARITMHLSALALFIGVATPTSRSPRAPRDIVSAPGVTRRVHAGLVHRIDRPTTWRADEVHEIAGTVVVESSGTLVIEAGTRVEARPGASIEISRDGRLIALGTALQPIVLTCTSVPKYPGCWNGLTIRGSAALNYGSPTSPPARGNGVAGCRETGIALEAHGGCDPADSSGALRYLRVENAARGLELLAVGSRTVLQNIQVNRSGGNGVTVAGGTVDLRNLFLTANLGYGLRWRSGWRGRGQFISIQQDALGNLGGISGSNEGASPSAETGEPRSAPTLINVTVVSPFSGGGPGTAPAAIQLERGTSGVLRNVLIHTAATALDIDDSRTCLQTAGSPRLTLTNVVIANTALLGSDDADPLSCEPYVSPNVEAELLADPANAVGVITNPVVALALLRNATDLSVPDLRPAAGGATVTNPSATPPNDGFFDLTAAFIGAVPVQLATRNGVPWYSGWTVPAPFAPLPGIVSGTVASLMRGPIGNAFVRSASGSQVTTSALGAYTLGLPAGDHLLTATSLPVGCGAGPRSLSLASGGTSTIDFDVQCNTVESVSVGALHSCALASTGRAQCWGNNEFGMLGDGTNIGPRTTPVLVSGNNTFEAGSLSSGYTHSCALRNGRAACWGLNFFVALGTAGFYSVAPVAVGNSGTPSFVRLSTGGYHGCGLTSSGAAWCWGWNQEGQAGPIAATSVLVPAVVPAGPVTFSQISAGESHTCALTAAGEAWCWGGNGRGELGSDPAVVGTQSATPILVPGGLVFASIDAGTQHTCGVTTTGEGYCWGSQEYGQLGNGVVSTVISAPVLVSGGSTYRQISAGGQTTCGVTTAKVVQCWGAGLSGVLGNGTSTATQSAPVTVSGGLAAIGVVVNLAEPSGAAACAYTTMGDTYCWGAGTAGQLGNGAMLSSTVPVQVLIRGPF